MDQGSKPKTVKIEETVPKRRRLRVGDVGFVPPDGGWGWWIVFACGFSNLSTFPMFQQFGLMFRQKFEQLGISNPETTTVINMNSAFNSCVGLLNGPIFKTFTYRQVAMFGSLLVAISLFVSTFCQNFWTYLIFYSMFYGSGIGITQSANALALNTFFKDKRRIATGLSWTTTALGPIVWPYIITAFLDLYGPEGALLIFAGFALHAFMCSLLLQPVEWHTKYQDEIEVEKGKEAEERKPFIKVPSAPVFEPGKLNKSSRNRSLLSSQYLYNEDDPRTPGYEIIDPGTPMMIRANDGWYSQNMSLVGSRQSLKGTSRGPSRLPSGQNSVAMSKRPSYNNLQESRSKRNSSINLVQDGAKDRKHQEGKERKRRLSQSKPAIKEEEEHHDNALSPPIVYPNEKDVLKTAAKKLAEYKHEQEEVKDDDEESYKKLNFCEKVCIFFDFDLFRDPVYVILMLGLSMANFVEINFSIITPMVLDEFNFQKYEIATFMSLLGATDIVVRFFIPFIADKIGWENRTFFLVGVLSMAFGRIVLVHTKTYYAGLLVAVIIGAGKGLRTIFIALVIPTHVPLERLPAASGLQLATSGFLFLVLGPVVGWVRDTTQNYVVTLHILNILTYATAVTWTLERYWSNRKKSKVKEIEK